MIYFKSNQLWETELWKDYVLTVYSSHLVKVRRSDIVYWVLKAFVLDHFVQIGKYIDQMVPVLHHYHARSVKIQYLHWREEWSLFFTAFSVDNWLQTDWWCDNDIRSIKIWKIDYFLFSGKHFNAHSEKVIFIILVFLDFLFVLNDPFQIGPSFLFINLGILIHSERLPQIILLINHKSIFNRIKYRLGITNIRSDDQIFCISKPFWFLTLCKWTNTLFLMLMHMIDYNISELFDCLLLLVLNMNVIDIVADKSRGNWILWLLTLLGQYFLWSATFDEVTAWF